MPLVHMGPQATDRCKSEALILDAHAKHVMQSRGFNT